jgi:hypothetical protein
MVREATMTGGAVETLQLFLLHQHFTALGKSARIVVVLIDPVHLGDLGQSLPITSLLDVLFRSSKMTRDLGHSFFKR